ncbi:MAG TPA: hypothetical protein VNO30_21050 [Kofleriaceae bacterium]|nr:hypothetical protein [Kofleriaceae bacterium]
MRTTVTILLAAVISIGSTACKKKEEKTPTTTAGSAGSADTMAGSGGSAGTMAGSGSGDMAGSGGSGAGAMAGSNAGSDSGSNAMAATPAPGEPEMKKNAGNCPSTVFGAVTKAEVKGKDVVLTITSEDKDAIASIQKRAEMLLKEKKDAPSGTVHDQKGSHGGGDGLCPVFWGEGGAAKSKKDAKGVTITITPKDKPDELKTKIDERITKAAAWVDKNIKPGAEGNKGAVGGGKGAHGGTHQGAGDSKGKERQGGTGGGAGTGGGGGKGTGGGADAKKDATK